MSFLVVCIRPYNVVFATVVEKKGSYPAIVKNATWVLEASLVHFAYRTDREEAIRDLLEDAVRKSGRPGKPLDPEQRLAMSLPTSAAQHPLFHRCLRP